MDKVMNIGKSGWHPSGDKQIRRDTWKSDLKSIAVRNNNKDPYEEQRNHMSAPLSSLRDPDIFGPPPKRGGTGPSTGLLSTSDNATGVRVSSGGLGAPAVGIGYAQRKRQEADEERQRLEQQASEQRTNRGPFRVDTTGLRSDHLPKPPTRRAKASPISPMNGKARLPPAVPPRQASVSAPRLPPTQNEYPDEYTPAPPPPYQEALRAQNSLRISQGAASRLGQAGLSVPGLGIGGSANTPSDRMPGGPSGGAVGSQLSDLQQRFAKITTGAGNNPLTPQAANASDATVTHAQKKPPPPLPSKKQALNAVALAQQSSGARSLASSLLKGNAPTPPPNPGNKPRPQ